MVPSRLERSLQESGSPAFCDFLGVQEPRALIFFKNGPRAIEPSPSIHLHILYYYPISRNKATGNSNDPRDENSPKISLFSYTFREEEQLETNTFHFYLYLHSTSRNCKANNSRKLCNVQQQIQQTNPFQPSHCTRSRVEQCCCSQQH